MSSAPATGLRADVQGLRAVAVLVVVAAHAGVPGMTGGFVGVDVFFVISGFLISQLLFREARRTGSVSLRDFYARRARRILPAATLVTVVTVAASVALLAAVDALSAVTDAWWATIFLANVRFADVGTDYFAQDQAESPLQHYWSLAVEEQFYVVWPLLLLVVCLGRRWRPRALVTVLLGFGAASFAYGAWLTTSDPVAAYFSAPARAWELGIGAAAALAAPRLAPRSRSARTALGGAGLVAIAAACVTFTETTRVPGIAAALPVLGSAAVLLAGARASQTVAWPTRLLGVAALRRVGDWSYSLYLWHWPLLVIPATASGAPLPAWARLVAVATAFALAGLTYRYVETPWRRPREAPRRRRSSRLPGTGVTGRGLVLYPVSVAVVAVSCVVATSAAEQSLGGGPPITVDRAALAAAGVDVSEDPTVALVQASVIAARADAAIPTDLESDLLALEDDVPDVSDCDYGRDGERDLCPRGDLDGERTLVVLGDSHGQMWIPAVERVALDAGYRAYYLVKPSCSAADITTSRPGEDEGGLPWPECDDFREWAIAQAGALDADLVLVASTPPGPHVFDDDGRFNVGNMDDSGRDKLVDAYTSTFERVDAVADRVVLLRDVPRVEQSVAQCLTGRGARLGGCLGTPLETREVLTGSSVEAAATAAIDVVDPRPWLCWDGNCPAVIGAHVAYRDQDHLTTAYAAELGDDLGRALGTWRG